MNIKDGIQVASMVKDVYIICADLPEKVSFEIEIDTNYNKFAVSIADRRGNWEYLTFRYHENMSPQINALGLKEWIATIL